MALEIERYEAEEARKRQGTRTDIVELIPPSESGKARDKAAAGVNRGTGEVKYSEARRRLPRIGSQCGAASHEEGFMKTLRANQ